MPRLLRIVVALAMSVLLSKVTRAAIYDSDFFMPADNPTERQTQAL